MKEALLDALIDSLKLIPYLFLAYLTIEYIEHKASDRMVASLSRFGRWSPVAGAAAGLVPQCGFSITAAHLYAGGLISFGTLLAVFVSTSDEAVPILLSAPDCYRYIPALLIIKLVAGVAVGLLADVVIRKNRGVDRETAHTELHTDCDCHECEHGILRPAIKHTVTSWLFILICVAVVNVLIYFVGDEAIASLFGSSAVVQPVVASLVGFIPNCASSIILTQLFVDGVIGFPALTAGLVTNAGIGYIAFFKTSRSKLKALLTCLFMWALSLLCAAAVYFLSL